MAITLASIDLSLRLTRAEAEARLKIAQRRLLHLRLVNGGLVGDGTLGPPLVILLEGWDAAGKGGAIRRIVAPLDARHVTVAPFAAPTDRELRHHFMWRFFPVLPGWGGMTVFDRSWYGRVLVERVESLISPEVWERSYDEINSIEQALHDEGATIIKLFLHISPEEQLRRFEARRDDPYKSWKLTDEDWRNRGKRAAYETAIDEMLARTDTPASAWDVIAADSKHYARVTVVETVVRRLEAGMRAVGIEPPPALVAPDGS